MRGDRIFRGSCAGEFDNRGLKGQVGLPVMLAGLSGTAAEWFAGILTAALLLFEIVQVRRERKLRNEAEAAANRERARRVSAWIEPIMWEYNRQGVVRYEPGGWKLVVSNDSDDSVTNWRAVVLNPSNGDRDLALMEAAGVQHGVIPPRSRFEADMPHEGDAPPSHADLDAIVALWWVDRDGSAWQSRGAAGPKDIQHNDDRWTVSHPDLAARRGGLSEMQGQGCVIRRTN